MANNFSVFEDFFSTDIRFHPVYLLSFFAIALVLYWRVPSLEKKNTNFFNWLFPKDIYLHASHALDIKLFLFGRIVAVLKIFNVLFIQTVFAFVGMGVVALLTGLEMSTQEVTTVRILLATFIITLVADFCVYWVHRIHHEAPVIWPFHAVHHSAEILTPVTVYRKHPVYDLISDITKAVLVGFIQGVILMLIMGKVQLSLIAGINAFYFAFNFLGSNFRHSHIWFSYGRILEHIFISPAQHQIHHSLEPKHHNKNYGEVLAIWDWIFGTLYIPDAPEKLSFGISKSSTSNKRIKQPHPTLKASLIVPFQDCWKSVKRRQSHKETRKEKTKL